MFKKIVKQKEDTLHSANITVLATPFDAIIMITIIKNAKVEKHSIFHNDWISEYSKWQYYKTFWTLGYSHTS